MQEFKAQLFSALAHPTRIRILELLRGGEQTVSELQAQLAIEATSVSQQLAVLRAKNIVAGRRVGTNVYYRVLDPKMYEILDVARVIFANHVGDLQAVADEAIGERA